MKMHFYEVKFFTNQIESLWAFSWKEAKILAQAQQILKGNDYEAESVSCKELNEWRYLGNQ